MRCFPPLLPQPRSPGDEVYLRTHRQRFALVLDIVHELGPARILVVGPGYDGQLLRDALPEAQVNTLGWHDHRFPLRDGEQHWEVDLNADERPALERHDLVLCGEVIEHLHVPPGPVLGYLATALEPGGRLILQTPNATALPKRLRMLFGRNPYDPIRDEGRNPGHFHEYTVRELLDAFAEAGLEVERWLTRNYFDHGSRKNRAYRAAGPLLPRTLREGITVVARSRR